MQKNWHTACWGQGNKESKKYCWLTRMLSRFLWAAWGKEGGLYSHVSLWVLPIFHVLFGICQRILFPLMYVAYKILSASHYGIDFSSPGNLVSCSHYWAYHPSLLFFLGPGRDWAFYESTSHIVCISLKLWMIYNVSAAKDAERQCLADECLYNTRRSINSICIPLLNTKFTKEFTG